MDTHSFIFKVGDYINHKDADIAILYEVISHETGRQCYYRLKRVYNRETVSLDMYHINENYELNKQYYREQRLKQILNYGIKN